MLDRFNYETFNEKSRFDKVRTFDASSPEKKRAAKRSILFDKSVYEEDVLDEVLKVLTPEKKMKKPIEPMFSLSELKNDPDRVAHETKAYETKLATFEKHHSEFKNLLTKLEKMNVKEMLDLLSDDQLDKVFQNIVMPCTDNGECQWIYETELEN